MGRALVELDFGKIDGSPTLERVRFRAHEGELVVETFRGDRFGHVGQAFSWTKALRALCLLLVHHATASERGSLIGGPKSPARTLFNLLEHPERSAAAIPFSTPDGICHLSALLERANPGSGPNGATRHWIAVRPEKLPPLSLVIRLNGYTIRDSAQLGDMAKSLSQAWSIDPAENRRPPSPPRPALPSTNTWNERIAGFYHRALTENIVTAAAGTLAVCVPGDLHLAFTASPTREFNFATSAGEAGRQFLLSTMGATASHPLIHRCHGRVRAISDVLDSPSWRERAMYQLARPHLRMEDALGTDLRLPGKDEMIFSLCVIRERRTFAPVERRVFELLTPHLHTALQMGMQPSAPTLHVIPLGEDLGRPGAPYRKVRERLHDALPWQTHREAPWQSRLESWLRDHEQGREVAPLLLRAGNARTNRPNLHCLPAFADEPATIIALAAG
jgi:hypothetical protein